MEGGGEGRGVGVELGVSWAARPLLLVLSEPALGSPLIQDLLACCTPRQDLFAPVGLPLLAPRAHRHAEELLRIGVAEQPCLPAPGAHAVELVGLDSLPRSAGPGVRRLARGARRRARVVVERAGGHRHGLRRTERGAFENGAHREDICVSLSTYGQCMPHAAATGLGLGQVPSSRPPFSRANIKFCMHVSDASDAPATGTSSTVAALASAPPSFSTTECTKRQLYNPGTATWTDAPDDPAWPVGRRGLWEALAGSAPPPPPAPAPEPEPEDSGLKFANAAPAAELLAPVFASLNVASLCPGASLDDAADFLSSQHGLATVGQIRKVIAHGDCVRPLHSLGRRLLKSSRLGYAQPFLLRLRSLVVTECEAQGEGQAQTGVTPPEAAAAAAAAAAASSPAKPPTLAAAPPGKLLVPREAEPGALLSHAVTLTLTLTLNPNPIPSPSPNPNPNPSRMR